MQSEESQKCQRKCTADFFARSAYCEATFSPEGKTPNANQFHACAIAALTNEIDCMRHCLERQTLHLTEVNMEPIIRKPSAAMQGLVADLRVRAENGDADAMFYLAGFLANASVAMQDATMLDEAEHWFLEAAAKDQPAAKGFVDEAWPVAKEFFRGQIAPRAA